MIRSATLVLLAAALGASASAQQAPAWQELAASPYNSYRSEDVFSTGERGWAGVGGGRAYRATDGGASWTARAMAPLVDALVDIRFGDHVAEWHPERAAPGLYVVRLQAGRGVWARSVAVAGR